MNALGRLVTRCVASWRRMRLAIAEQDLRWMEEIGAHNLARQRDQVTRLRRSVVVGEALISARDVERRAERQLKRGLLS